MDVSALPKKAVAALSEAAWKARQNARIIGQTAVGCAVMEELGAIYLGCNVEHRFRSHDIHAEVGALSSLVASGGGRPAAVFIAAEREQFTPCGACLDWIIELGGPDCLVLCQNSTSSQVTTYSARELMPHYPK